MAVAVFRYVLIVFFEKRENLLALIPFYSVFFRIFAAFFYKYQRLGLGIRD